MKRTLLTFAVTSLLATTAFSQGNISLSKTPLHTAAEDGELSDVQAELNKGADVNARDGIGRTPLHYATTRDHKEIVELLIANDADVNVIGISGTPLHVAAMEGHKEITELLISNGADVNKLYHRSQIDFMGHFSFQLESPLSMAILAKQTEIADLLRKHGGKTPEELPTVRPRLMWNKVGEFSFVADKGKTYEVQDSFDLLNWEVIKTYNGRGTTIQFDDNRDHDPPQIFYRVRVVE